MTEIAALQVGPTPSGRAAASAPPPWSLMVPDARQGALSDAARAAERQTAQRAPASGEHDRPPTARIDAPFGADGFSFTDMLDVINPLQHLPIVSTIYRELTGDEISPGARVAGGTLFGGAVGLFAGAANAAMAESTGKDMGEHALAYLFGEEDAPADPGTAIAAVPPGDDANLGEDGPRADADAPSAPGPQVAALGAPPAPAATPHAPQQTAFFRSLQQPKSHETPEGVAAGPAQAAGDDRPTAQQAALQAGRIRAHTGTGVPDGAPGGIAPTAFLPAAPAAPAARPGPESRAGSQEPAVRASSSAQAPPPQAGGAPAGPTRLSPAAAQALMRLAEQSAAPTAPEPAPSDPAPSAPGAAAPGPTADAAAPTAAPTPQAPPLDQVPEAMMAALKKYEALKRGE